MIATLVAVSAAIKAFMTRISLGLSFEYLVRLRINERLTAVSRTKVPFPRLYLKFFDVASLCILEFLTNRHDVGRSLYYLIFFIVKL